MLKKLNDDLMYDRNVACQMDGAGKFDGRVVYANDRYLVLWSPVIRNYNIRQFSIPGT